MKFENPINPNYSAVVVPLKDFVDLPNCDNVKAALIFGNSVIVSKSAEAGTLGVFFPVECALSKAFLSANNLYRKAEWGNVDTTKTGFFEQQGRVKAMKVRGHKSEGFWMPIDCLAFTEVGLENFTEGLSFDHVNTTEICRKYIPAGKGGTGQPRMKGKVARIEDAIVEQQFRFHFDTENLRRNIDKISPEDYISITDKWHGTSAVFSKILVKRQLNWIERILSHLRIRIQETDYGLAYSSRRVVKNVAGIDKSNNVHFYGSDIWGVVASEIDDRIPLGYTLYGEIVGFTPEGKAIQAAPGGKPYHYGSGPGQHQFVVYRVTITNPEGKTLELSWPQMKEFCTKYGLQIVKELFYGRASELVPFTPETDIRDWQPAFLAYLETRWVNDSMCIYNAQQIPAEGIVVRIDSLEECRNYKLKNFAFLEAESKMNDSGILDIETAESSEELLLDEQPQ